jgi:hypothetical protein
MFSAHIADSSLSPQELAQNFPPHCRLIAAHRAAGAAPAGTLNPQLSPSALRPILPAAKAALVALMQNTRIAAAMISMVSFMAHSLQNCRDIGFDLGSLYHEAGRGRRQEIGPVLA